MLSQLSRNWWMLALRGLAAIVFGVVALAWPEATYAALVILFGAYALLDGLLAVLAALTNRTGEPRWAALSEGLVGIAIAVATFAWPGATALSLLYLIAAWAIFTGVPEILIAIDLRKELEGEWLLILSGIASVAFGVLVILFPGAGAVSVAWMIGAYAVVFGVLLVALSLKIRRFGLELQTAGL